MWVGGVPKLRFLSLKCFFYELSPLNYADHYGYDDHIVTTLVALVDQSLIKHQIFAHCILQKEMANKKLVSLLQNFSSVGEDK